MSVPTLHLDVHPVADKGQWRWALTRRDGQSQHTTDPTTKAVAVEFIVSQIREAWHVGWKKVAASLLDQTGAGEKVVYTLNADGTVSTVREVVAPRADVTGIGPRCSILPVSEDERTKRRRALAARPAKEAKPAKVKKERVKKEKAPKAEKPPKVPEVRKPRKPRAVKTPEAPAYTPPPVHIPAPRHQVTEAKKRGRHKAGAGAAPPKVTRTGRKPVPQIPQAEYIPEPIAPQAEYIPPAPEPVQAPVAPAGGIDMNALGALLRQFKQMKAQ